MSLIVGRQQTFVRAVKFGYDDPVRMFELAYLFARLRTPQDYPAVAAGGRGELSVSA